MLLTYEEGRDGESKSDSQRRHVSSWRRDDWTSLVSRGADECPGKDRSRHTDSSSRRITVLGRIRGSSRDIVKNLGNCDYSHAKEVDSHSEDQNLDLVDLREVRQFPLNLGSEGSLKESLEPLTASFIFLTNISC